ncbi:MAG: glycosyltransferase family 2 protein [Lachnospiraceae bacterium]|nr:glycosyltransferase family 2 protein [Lachnospiraceae bacterium]
MHRSGNRSSRILKEEYEMHILFVMFVVFQIVYIFLPLIKERPNREPLKLKSEDEKGLTILVPAYNEELVIEKCCTSLIHVDYTHYEIILINDGSTDQTLLKLKELLHLEPYDRSCNNKLQYGRIKSFYHSLIYPNVYVIDKENGGKADSLNAGIDYSMNDIVITLDADSLLEKDSLKYISCAFESQKVIAVGGMVHIIQGFVNDNGTLKPSLKNTNALIKHQIIQYLDGFCLNKYTHSCLNAITVIAGAFGAFKKDVLFNVGGFRKTVGEDMDITLKFQKYIKLNNQKERMLFIPEAICYTQCPEDFKNLMNQRFRWQRAFIDCIIYYWNDLFNNFSFLTSMYLLFDSFILGTLVSFSTILIPLLILILPNSGVRALIILFLTSFCTALLQDTAILFVMRRFEYKFSLKDYIRFIGFAIFECFTYRCMGIIYVVFGTISYFINTHGWKEIERVQFNLKTR